MSGAADPPRGGHPVPGAAPSVTFLDPAVFNDNLAAITGEVGLLVAAKGDVRRRARIVVCRSDHEGELLAEVVATTFGAVLRYREGDGELNRKADSYMTFRRGGWTLAPLTGDRGQLIEAHARSGIYGLFGSYFIDQIAAGVKEFTAQRPERAPHA